MGVLLFSSAGAAGQASAQGDGSVDLKVQAGWNGLNKYQGSAPLVAEIGNLGPDATLDLEAVLYPDWGPGSMEKPLALASYVRRVPLAKGERKRVVLHFPTSSPVKIDVRVKRDGALVASASPRIQSFGNEFTFVGALAGQPERFAFLRDLALPGPVGRPQFVPLTPEVIPGTAPELAALDAIIIDDPDPAGLAAEQREALAGWVRRGGTLILSAGPRGQRALEILAPELRPARVEGMRSVLDLPALSSYGGKPLELQAPLALADLADLSGQVVLAEGLGGAEIPLLVEGRYGEGRVLLAAFDLSGEPILGWAGKEGFFVQLLSRGRSPVGGPWGPWGPNAKWERFNGFNWMLRFLPAEAFPPVRTVGLALLAFILLAGPVNYLVLRRLDRRDLAWVTLPALALAAVGATYTLAFLRDGRETLTTTLSALEIDPRSGFASQDAFVGVFAPITRRLDVDVPAGLAVWPMPVTYGPGPMPGPDQDEPPYRVVLGAASRVEFGPKTQWGLRTLRVSRDLRLPGAIASDLRLTEKKITGTVTNETPYRLEDTAVVVGGRLARLGDLRPGERREVALDLEGKVEEFWGGIGYRLFNDPPAPPKPGEPPPAPPPPLPSEKQRRMQLADNLFNGPMGQGGLPVMFIGFTRERTLDVRLPGPDRHRFDLALVSQPLALNWPPGAFTVPRDLITAQMIEMNGGGGGGPMEFHIQNGYMVLHFTLPLPSEARVQKVTLFLDAFAPMEGPFPGPDGKPSAPPRKALTGRTLQVYNWSTGQWDPLPGEKTIAIPRPDDHLSGNVLRLRVNADEGPVIIRTPTLEAGGTVAQGSTWQSEPPRPGSGEFMKGIP